MRPTFRAPAECLQHSDDSVRFSPSVLILGVKVEVVRHLACRDTGTEAS
jgi:hypothetical protein